MRAWSDSGGRAEREVPNDASPSRTYWLESLFLFSAISIFGFVWMSGMRSGFFESASEGLVHERDRQEFRERVERHRLLTGAKINRERIDVEIRNEQLAPRLPEGARPTPQTERPFGASNAAPQGVSYGLSLEGEQHHRKSSRDRLESLNPNYPDARILMTLQDEQEGIVWEKKAQQLYIKEFLANAAKQGVKLRVDKDGNVTIDERNSSPSDGLNQKK